MRQTSLISVVIPAFNSEKTIENCLASVFKQSHKGVEIIVVNDGSSDDTLAKLRPYWERGRIKVINQANKGAPAARNRGFREARGEYVIFCDADIIFKKQALKKMLLVLWRHPEASYAYSSFKLKHKRFHLHPFDAEKLKQINYIHTTSLIRSEHFPDFDESLERFQDWDLWLTMLEQGREGVWVPEFLFKIISKGVISAWMPKAFYKIPWDSLGWKPKAMEKYEQAKKVIEEKHNLT